MTEEQADVNSAPWVARKSRKAYHLESSNNRLGVHIAGEFIEKTNFTFKAVGIIREGLNGYVFQVCI